MLTPQKTVAKQADIKKNNQQERNHAKSTIKTLEKSGKPFEKQIHNLKRDLEISRENLKNLRSDHSSLEISKAKLETEKRKLEKTAGQKDSKIAKLKKEGLDLNKNFLKGAAPFEYSPKISSLPSRSTQELHYFPPSSTSGPLYSSMITHWNPLPLVTSTIITMVTHTVQQPPPISSLWNAQEYPEMIDKMCERVFAKLGWEKFK